MAVLDAALLVDGWTAVFVVDKLPPVTGLEATVDVVPEPDRADGVVDPFIADDSDEVGCVLLEPVLTVVVVLMGGLLMVVLSADVEPLHPVTRVAVIHEKTHEVARRRWIMSMTLARSPTSGRDRECPQVSGLDNPRIRLRAKSCTASRSTPTATATPKRDETPEPLVRGFQVS